MFALRSISGLKLSTENWIKEYDLSHEFNTDTLQNRILENTNEFWCNLLCMQRNNIPSLVASYNSHFFFLQISLTLKLYLVQLYHTIGSIQISMKCNVIYNAIIDLLIYQKLSATAVFMGCFHELSAGADFTRCFQKLSTNVDFTSCNLKEFL